MPSATPARKFPSPLASRNTSRSDIVASRGVDEDPFTTSSVLSASHKMNDLQKENTGRGNSRGIGNFNLNENSRSVGRSQENIKGPSKKPWVTHFARPTATKSPTKVLVERNACCSPVRPSSLPTRVTTEALNDKKEKSSSAKQQEQVPVSAAAHVKGVAELSKRIQQFLEDKDALAEGQTRHSHHQGLFATPVEQSLRTSPYNPYNSPFFERPKFLRLHDNAFPTDGDMLKELTNDEISSFEQEQALVTTLQPIQLSARLLPICTNDQELEPAEETEQQISPKKVEEPCSDVPKVDVPNASLHRNIDSSMEIVMENVLLKEDADHTSLENPRNEITEVEADREDTTLNAKNNHMVEATLTSKDSDNMEESPPASKDDEIVDLAEEYSSGGVKVARLAFGAAFLTPFVIAFLLCTGSSGLLPPLLRSDPIQKFWHASKTFELSQVISTSMVGLWGSGNVYVPVDVHFPLLNRGEELLRHIKELTTKVGQEMQLHIQLIASTLHDWEKLFVKQFFSSEEAGSEGNIEEDRGRQFEWIPNYSFEEEWNDKEPEVAYTDWELLYEYDLVAANQYVLGSIPDNLKSEFQRNVSGLSDSPAVKLLLEDLMKLKGGSTEDDRMEVLQYFWEYTKFSAQVTMQEVSFSSSSEVQENGHTFATIQCDNQAPIIAEDMEEKGCDTVGSYLAPERKKDTLTKAEFEQSDSTYMQEMPLQPKPKTLCDILSTQIETESEKIQASVPMINMTLKTIQEARVHGPKSADGMDMKSQPLEPLLETIQTTPDRTRESQTTGDAIAISDQTETDNMDKLFIDSQEAFDVELNFPQLVTVATFIASSFFILGCFRQSRVSATLLSPVSNVQFLRKTANPSKGSDQYNSKGNDQYISKQEKLPVTMIEELDKFASILQASQPTLTGDGPNGRRDEDLLQSPYGSFTTLKLVSKKEGETVEKKLTPVRRSSRIRNNQVNTTMSPAKRIAISPP